MTKLYLLFLVSVLGLAACDQGPAEEAGENIDEAMEEVGDEIDDAT
ncbi:hypothetical protein [Pseudohongiella acticola]|jgi:hypothetical protein|nr:hypothetical protein [Pseudohongiella acticola]|tara:strand:- start:985 stop:1122 length:138 start_codon:yes stop_codon:yes gene_type:complete